MSDEEKLKRRRERQVDIYQFLIVTYLIFVFQAKALGKQLDIDPTGSSSMLKVRLLSSVD
jgi:hypothetical protein